MNSIIASIMAAGAVLGITAVIGILIIGAAFYALIYSE